MLGEFYLKKNIYMNMNYSSLTTMYESMFTQMYIFLVENNFCNFGQNKNFMVTRIDVYETLCPQQMLVHKGGKIKNWGGECRDVTPTKSLSQNIRVDVNREVKFL